MGKKCGSTVVLSKSAENLVRRKSDRSRCDQVQDIEFVIEDHSDRQENDNYLDIPENDNKRQDNNRRRVLGNI